MIRLVLCDLKDHAATWIGALIVAIGCGYIGGWVVSLQATADFYVGGMHWSLQNAATMMLVFSVVAGVAVLMSASSLTVSMQRRSYALWQLANVSPRKVILVVLVQLAIVALFGAMCGTLITAVTFEALFPWVFSAQSIFEQVEPHAGILRMPAVWLVVAAVFFAGGIRSAVSAGRTPPLTALREPEVKAKGITWLRVLLFASLIACVFFVYTVMVDSTPYDASSWAVLVPVLSAAAFTSVAPLFFSLLLTAWTALVPQKRWIAWYLARRNARYGFSTSTSVETPIMMGFGLVAGLFSVLNVFAEYDRSQGISDTSGWSLDLTTGLIVLGGPVLLCAIGAAISVAMSSRSRNRDVALLTACGSQTSTMVVEAVCEALIHAVTAILVGMISVVVSVAIVAHALGLPLLQGVTFEAGIIVSLVGFALVLIATLVPTLSALNGETAAVLAMRE